MEDAPLGGLSPKEFLRRHWQKRPLLVRRALPGFRGVIGKRALFALAARRDVESRLVRRRGKAWQAASGPLPVKALQQSSARNCTLLVHGVNLFEEKAETLLRRFAFIPQARLDDVMVSYAAPGGGVGPHFDSYDVFLVQGTGRRIWRLARPRPFTLAEGAPLKLIEGFKPEEEYLLEPGDLLYLPPGWGHDGVALEECFTCSIGFRAPRAMELGAAFLDYLHERGLPDAHYRDPELRPSARPARIDARMIDFAAKQLGKIRWKRSDVEDFVGRFLTLPKPHVVFTSKRPSRERQIRLSPKTQLLYRGSRFFINGESFVPKASQRRALRALADRRRASARALARAGLAGLIFEWRESGYLQ
jgi:50S ribosomal protein L16 3-hydroxylase